MVNIAVADTNIIIRLSKIDIIKNLGKLYDEIYIPQAVKDECKDIKSSTALNLAFFRLIPVKKLLPISGIALGEHEAISLAKENNIQTFLTDDILAEKKASKVGLTTLSSYDLLVLFKYAGLIKSAKQCMDDLKSKNEGIDNNEYLDVLRKVGEW